MYIHNKELYVQLKWFRTPRILFCRPFSNAAVTAVFPIFFLDLDRWACPSGPHNLSHGCETNKCDQVSAAASSSAPQLRGQPIGSDDVTLWLYRIYDLYIYIYIYIYYIHIYIYVNRRISDICSWLLLRWFALTHDDRRITASAWRMFSRGTCSSAWAKGAAIVTPWQWKDKGYIHGNICLAVA